MAFKAKNVEVIINVLGKMKLAPKYNEKLQQINTSIGTFDLNTGQAKVRSSYKNLVNDFRVEYSKNILEIAAKKKKWVLKKRATNKYVAKKW